MDSINELTRELESVIDRFETARSTDHTTDLEAFLPQTDDADYTRILVELIRADMEFSWEEGTPRRLASYRERFQEIADDVAAIEVLAFEEYRLRFQHGESVLREEYSAELGVDTAGWPVWCAEDGADSVFGTRQPVAESSGLFCDSEAAHESNGRFPEVGTRFGHFELAAVLGSGTFAKVYLARQPSLANQFVALKVTTSSLDASSLDEAQRLAQLQHTNIVPIHSVHRTGSFHVICMPFLGAATLANVVRDFDAQPHLPESGEWFLSTVAGCRASTLARSCVDSGDNQSEAGSSRERDLPSLQLIAKMSYPQAAVWLMARVAAGVSHAHQHGFVHGDLKPANILLSDEGEPLIVDFNLSFSASNSTGRETVVGGTLPYMSREHIEAVRTNTSVDIGSDIFSFGVILYELLTGQLPYPVYDGPFEDVTSRMMDDRQSEPQPVRRLNPAISPDVETIVLQCLSPDPKARYQDACQLHADLTQHLENRPLQFAANRSVLERWRKWTRRHPRISSATSVFAGALIIVAILAAFLAVKSIESSRLRANQFATNVRSELESLGVALNTGSVVYGGIDETINEAAGALERSRLDELALGELPEEFHPIAEGEQARLRKQVGQVQHLLAAANFRKSLRSPGIDGQRTLLARALDRSKASESTFLEGQRPKSLYALKARILDQLGDEEQAEIARRKAARTALQGVEDRQLLVHQQMLGHQHPDTVQLESALQTSRSYFTGWFVLGQAYTQLRRLHDADRAFTACLAIEPDSARALFQRSVARHQLAKYSESLSDIDRAIRLRPDRAPLLFNRALTYRQLGRLGDAERDLSRALELGASETRILFVRSRVRRQLGDEEGARQDQEAGRQRTPSDELSWVSRGMSRRINDPEGAIRDFEAALNLNPGSWRALQNLAEMLGHQPGGLEEATSYLDRLVEVEPSRPKMAHVAWCLFGAARLGRSDKAISDAEAALKLRQDADTLYRVAGIYAQTSVKIPGNAEIAIELLGRAAIKDPMLVLKYVPADPDLKPLAKDEQFGEFRHTLRKFGKYNVASKSPLAAK